MPDVEIEGILGIEGMKCLIFLSSENTNTDPDFTPKTLEPDSLDGIGQSKREISNSPLIERQKARLGKRGMRDSMEITPSDYSPKMKMSDRSFSPETNLSGSPKLIGSCDNSYFQQLCNNVKEVTNQNLLQNQILFSSLPRDLPPPHTKQ
jgi:hypothetical protein